LNFPKWVVVFVALASIGLSGCGDKGQDAAGGKPADAAKAAGGAGGGKPGGGDGKPKGLPVKAMPVRVLDVSSDVSAVGTLLADESVMIRPEIDGRVDAIHFLEGQTVSKGQKLVSLDPAELKAQMSRMEVLVRTEQQRLDRAKDLLAQQFIAQEAVDLAKNNLDSAVAQRREAEARLTKTTIIAPFAGTIGLRLISPGAYVRKGDDIARLESISNIKVDFRIPEAFTSKVRAGQDMHIRLDAFPGDEFAGRIYAIEPMVDERSRTVLIRGRINNTASRLKPGMFVRVLLTFDKRINAIVVPEPAIWPQGKDSFVYKVVDGKAILTKIAVGTRRPGEVEVTSGLSAGDLVVTEGQIKLKDGAPVMVLPAPAPAGGQPPAAKQS
jgi:membrane fusion protein (multidrug efflux system)